jgi:hypothetical protein
MEEFTAAVHNWYSEATGLQTIWQDQSAPRPDYPYASLIIISGPTPDSPVWEQRTTFDASRPLEEIEFNACVPCTFTIGTQVYVTVPDSRDPSQNATQYAARAQAALNLHTYRADFRAASIAVVDQGTVNNIDEIIDDAYVSRASMDVIFRAALNAQSYETYIEKVQLSSTSLGIDMEVSL